MEKVAKVEKYEYKIFGMLKKNPINMKFVEEEIVIYVNSCMQALDLGY